MNETATIIALHRPLSILIRVGDGLERVVWTLTLDDKDGRGLVTVTGDDFAASYYWPRANRGGGRTLPAFLFGVGLDYFADKMGADAWFDADATSAASSAWLAEQVRHARRAVDPDDIRDLLNPSFHYRSDWEEWCRRVEAADIPDAFYSGTVECVRPDVRRFYEAAWPVLRERRAEIESALYAQSALSDVAVP